MWIADDNRFGVWAEFRMHDHLDGGVDQLGDPRWSSAL